MYKQNTQVWYTTPNISTGKLGFFEKNLYKAPNRIRIEHSRNDIVSVAHYYGKKKKRAIGRPPGGHSNLENGQRKPGKRRKRRKLILTHRKKSMATATNGGLNAFEDDFGESSDGESMMRDYDDDSDASFDTRKKRCYKHRVLPPTEICTRGGDRPRFGFERLTHQKILLGSPRKKHKRMDVTEVRFVSRYFTQKGVVKFSSFSQVYKGYTGRAGSRALCTF